MYSKDYRDGWNCAVANIYISQESFRSEEARRGYEDCLRTPLHLRIRFEPDWHNDDTVPREKLLDDLLHEILASTRSKSIREKIEKVLK